MARTVDCISHLEYAGISHTPLWSPLLLHSLQRSQCFVITTQKWIIVVSRYLFQIFTSPLFAMASQSLQVCCQSLHVNTYHSLTVMANSYWPKFWGGKNPEHSLETGTQISLAHRHFFLTSLSMCIYVSGIPLLLSLTCLITWRRFLFVRNKQL